MNVTPVKVVQWTVEQILKDSECYGNPFRCHWYDRDNHPQFHSCKPKEDVEVE